MLYGIRILNNDLKMTKTTPAHSRANKLNLLYVPSISVNETDKPFGFYGESITKYRIKYLFHPSVAFAVRTTKYTTKFQPKRGSQR